MLRMFSKPRVGTENRSKHCCSSQELEDAASGFQHPGWVLKIAQSIAAIRRNLEDASSGFQHPGVGTETHPKHPAIPRPWVLKSLKVPGNSSATAPPTHRTHPRSASTSASASASANASTSASASDGANANASTSANANLAERPCAQGAFKVHSRPTQGACEVHSRCTQGACKVHYRCIPYACEVLPRCIQGALKLHARSIHG